MPNNPNYRLPAAVIEADRDSLLALKDLSDFTPVNQAHSAASLGELEAALTKAEEGERRAQKALAATRDIASSAGWDFHKSLLGAKNMVIAQYGNDSLAVQAIGLKKKSERKRPVRRRSEPTS